MITMTTVKMATTRSEDQDVAQRCDIAGELLDGLSAIPTVYVQATSTAMVSSTMPWSEWDVLPTTL